jgi:hypothetical protein
MKYKFSSVILFLLISAQLFAQPKISDISTAPGAFSRMGFGARGISMGNSISAVTTGNLVSYYNPALASFQNETFFQTAYTFLSMDRTLNYFSFTKQFVMNRKERKAVAGISAGIINAGISNIDGRDAQGIKTGDLSTSENQFFVAVSSRLSKNFALGFNIKIYYYSLYENFSVTAAGLDFGAIYKPTENLNFSFVVVDINSKYKWDSTPLYDLDGRITTDKFPMLIKFGSAYTWEKYNLLISGEVEFSNYSTKYLRGGIEYKPIKNFALRAGFDRLNLANSDETIRPSAGFEYAYKLGNYIIGINYAYSYEPFSLSDRHIVGIMLNLL